MESLLMCGDSGAVAECRRADAARRCADVCGTPPDRRCGDTAGLAAERRRREQALLCTDSGPQSDQIASPTGIDPTSHRVIEKRRRDRMNSCLADLARLVPSCHQRKGRGRIEKNEIIELAIKHIRHLQAHPCSRPDGSDETESFQRRAAAISNRYEEGYRECLRETMQWMVEHEGFIPGDPLCARLMNHLHEHIALVLRGGFPPRPHHGSRDQSSVSGSTSGYNGGSNGSSSDGNQGSPPAPQPQTDLLPPDAGGLLSSGMSLLLPPQTENSALRPPRPPHEPDPEYEQTQPYKLPNGSGDMKRAHAPSESSSRSSEECNAFQYKFKTNLKKRFSADMADRFCVGASKRARLTADMLENTTSSDDVKSTRLPESLPALLPRGPGLGGQKVPVFALHSKGALYLPMVVDIEALGSQAMLLTAEPLPITHPINISVCFCEGRPPDEGVGRAGRLPPTITSSSGVSSAPPERITSEEQSST